MIKKQKIRAVVIGGGIHGITSSITLAKNNVDVTLIEKNDELLKGTSGATQNRAHLGCHYPRCIETASECLHGLRVFEERYPQALVHPNEAYYLIEKESSKVSPEEFRAFCDQMKIPYEIEMPSKHFVNKDSISESFKVPEPVFDLEILAGLLKDEASELGIRLRTGFEVVCFNIQGNQYIITARRNREQTNYDADILLNATYAYTNNILRIIGLEEDMTEYALQRTEVAIARSKIEIPALTIMDGEFISVLPYGREQNLVLVYDVIHSVVDKENGFFLDDTKKYPTNWNKMIAHGEKYLPFIRNLDYVDSLWGARPIPSRITGDSRKTRIRSHKKCPGIYSILEGKFISAPLVADRLIEQMRIDGFVK